MKLTYLKTPQESGPSSKLREIFESTSIVESSDSPFHTQVGPIEGEMREKGSYGFDIDDFILCTPDFYNDGLGAVVGRNRFNLGVVQEYDFPVKVGAKQITPKVKFGGTPVRITKASRLPFNGKKQRILCVSPHYEEEATLFPAALHKLNGDYVHVSVVTPIPVKKEKPDLERITREVYEKFYGLGSTEYSFMGIPDMKVAGHEKEFKKNFEKLLSNFNPTTIITTPWGANFDHSAVGGFIYDLIENEGINFLYGNVLQNTEFRPTLFPVVDGKYRDKLVATFADDKIGNGKDHLPTIDVLFSPLPESINRYVGILKEKGKIPANENIGVYALQPVKLDAETYEIPHNTRIFSE
jgi:hypothetical protein